MNRSINGIVVEGGGIRITWDTGKTNQFVWKLIDGQLTLTLDNNQISTELSEEIIDLLTPENVSISLWSHLFGTSNGHVLASADLQVGDTITEDTWTRLIWNNIQLRSHISELTIDTTTGIISLPAGEWNVDASMLWYDSSASVTSTMMHFYDEDLGSEIDFSFIADSSRAAADAPKYSTTNTIIELSSGSKRVSVRVQSDASTSIFGSHPSNIPVGSRNYAGLLKITRLG